MARTVTFAELLTDFEQRADIEQNQLFSTAEKKRLVNQGLTRLYDELVRAAPPDYYLTTTSFSTSDGTSDYSLPADFYKLRRVQVSEQGNRRRSLKPMQPDERIVMVPPGGGSTMYVEYIKACPVLVNDGDTFNGVNGWEELVTLWCAIKAYRKMKLPIGDLQNEYTEMLQRVRENAYQDVGSPPMIQRASLRDPLWPWTSSAQPVTHYRLITNGATHTLQVWRIDLIATVPA